MKYRGEAVNNVHGAGGSASSASRHPKGMGKVPGKGFGKLGISKPMMAPPAVLAPNSMFDSKMALYAAREIPKAS